MTAPSASREKISQYVYKELDSSNNEIRILRFLGPPVGRGELIRCTLQHVSLDQLLPAYQEHKAELDFLPATNLARAWLRKYHPQDEEPQIEGSYFVIDASRFRAESEALYYLCSGECSEGSTVPVPSRFTWGDFEALSYCWGSDVRDKTILVDGCALAVPTNLETLLRRVQRLVEAQSGMGFWADGVCINQSNIPEKEDQIKMMKRIFSQAMSTVVWLGPGTEDSDRAIDILIDISRDGGYLSSVDGRERWGYSAPRGHVSGQDWKALLDLLSRDYFGRMWIIQELALNKSMMLFTCGQRQFPRATLLAACSWVQQQASIISREIRQQFPDETDTIYVNPDTVWQIADKVSTLVTLFSEKNDFDRMFSLANKSEVKEAHDKIYALLGLLPETVANHIEPEYSKSKQQVFTEFATLMLNRCERLDEVLSWCTFHEGSDLPSWVPDWTIQHKRNHLQWFRRREAGGDIPPRWRLMHSGKVLCSKGMRIDRVSNVSVPCSRILPYGEVSSEVPQPSLIRSLYGRYDSKDKLSRALERTLFHDHPYWRSKGSLLDLHWIHWHGISQEWEHELDTHQMVSHPWRIFECFRQSNSLFNVFGLSLHRFFPEEDEWFDHPQIERLRPGLGRKMSEGTGYTKDHAYNLKLAAVALRNRRLITTDTGYLGLAPDEVQAGDTVAVLVGCNYPVILRSHGDRYLYVGECYVDGLMQGKAIQDVVDGELQVEEIMIA